MSEINSLSEEQRGEMASRILSVIDSCGAYRRTFSRAARENCTTELLVGSGYITRLASGDYHYGDKHSGNEIVSLADMSHAGFVARIIDGDIPQVYLDMNKLIEAWENKRIKRDPQDFMVRRA